MLHIVKREHLYNDQDSRITSIQSDEDTLVLYSSSNSRMHATSIGAWDQSTTDPVTRKCLAWPHSTHTWLRWRKPHPVVRVTSCVPVTTGGNLGKLGASRLLLLLVTVRLWGHQGTGCAPGLGKSGASCNDSPSLSIGKIYFFWTLILENTTLVQYFMNI